MYQDVMIGATGSTTRMASPIDSATIRGVTGTVPDPPHMFGTDLDQGSGAPIRVEICAAVFAQAAPSSGTADSAMR